MRDARQSAVDYAHQNRQQFLSQLKSLVAIPSVSTDPVYQPDMRRAADFLADHLRSLGLDHVQVYPTEGHPVVYGDWLKAGTDHPTVLIYGHYDVQPAEPLDLWETPAYKPVERDGYLYGRGASDMKGQVMASLAAVESILKTSTPTNTLPVNIKYILEGEEEIGSPHLAAFMEAHKELLACSAVLNPDAGMISSEIPTIVYALRGLAFFEVRVYGPARDLHSGMFGGVVHNPAIALAELIAGMHDANGHITLPDFYDSVRTLDEDERKELARLPIDADYYQRGSGVPAVHVEQGFTPVEAVGARPSLDVNGMISGFTGNGSKTIIPAYAMAKISMRLVPDQDPAQVYDQLTAYMREHAPATIRWEVVDMKGGPASMTPRDTAATQALEQALETVWGKRPVFKREGGSIPVVGEMQTILGVQSVLTGFGLPDDHIHSPNERLHLETWARGIDALVHFFYNLDQL